MTDMLKKIPVREQEAKVRATNFEEVCLGYNQEEAMEEATRCINCKNAKCIEGCPVGIDIPKFIAALKEGDVEESYKIIGQSSALPAVCGRVCPQ
ncbi:MAG: dihydropyrimidine dehydrogenase, partial [Lachnospiraceae bacterium]